MEVNVTPVTVLLVELVYDRSDPEVPPVVSQRDLQTERHWSGDCISVSHSPDLLLGLHHVQDVPQVDAGQQLHGSLVFCWGQNLDTVVRRESELLRDRDPSSEETEADQQEEEIDNHRGALTRTAPGTGPGTGLVRISGSRLAIVLCTDGDIFIFRGKGPN